MPDKIPMNRPVGIDRAVGWALRNPGYWSAGLALICYVNVLPNEFTHDSVSIVEQNPRVHTPGQWGAIWTTDYWWHTESEVPNRDLLYRPVAVSSFRLVRWLLGPASWPQNALNIVLHALVSACVAHLMIRLGGAAVSALVAGLLFAVLPIHTEAVAAVVGRADLLAALGLLCALLCHFRAVGFNPPMNPSSAGAAPSKIRALSGLEPAARWCWHGLSALAAFVAVGSKESAVGLVILIPLFEVYCSRLDRRQVSIDLSPRPLSLRRLVASFLTSFVPVALYLWLRYYALGGAWHQQPAVSKTVNVLVDAPPGQHILGVVQLWGMYWTKTLWPAVLAVNYSINAIRLATTWLDSSVLAGVLVTAALAAASVVSWRRGSPRIALLFTATLITFAPTSNAWLVIRVFFAERIWYLPSVWVVMLLAEALVAVMFTSVHKPQGIHPTVPQAHRPMFPYSPRRFVAPLLLVIVVAMTVRCWIRNVDWRNNGTLCAAAYRDLPDSIEVLHLYGQWLVQNGQPKKGITLLAKAVEMDLGYTQAHRTLGQAYRGIGDYPHALHHLQIAAMHVPGHGPTEEALEKVRAALAETPDEELKRIRQLADLPKSNIEQELALLQAMRARGLIEETLQRLQQHEQRYSTSADWQAEYAVTLVFLNQLDQAIDRYRQSLARDAGRSSTSVELAMLLLERRHPGDIDEAERLAAQASRLTPVAPAVLVCQAELSALRGNLEAARRFYEKAINALEQNDPLRRIYGERAKTLGN